jgi:5-methylcytosine-specific restriction endonuclease McrA
MMKVCTRCGEEKPLEDFYKEKFGKFGRRSKCILCYKEISSGYSKKRWADGKRNDPVRAREARKRWAENNSEYRKEYEKKYREDNKDILNAKRRSNYANNPEYKTYVLRYVHKRRTRINNAEGSFTPEEWLRLLECFGNRCLVLGCDNTDITVDHVIPISKGGSNTIDNLQPLCRHHNAVKHDKIIDYRDTCEINF